MPSLDPISRIMSFFFNFIKLLSNFFLPDEEIVVYKSKDEAIEKIKYLLNHKDKVKEIALKGQ